MKIYVTKYLFTEGIQEMDGEDLKEDYPGMAVVRGDRADPCSFDQYFHGGDWHATREAAVAHAQTMRTKKLAALDKQRKKIEAMSFA